MNYRKWTFEELGVSGHESPRSLRGTYPRYSLRVDDQWHYPKSRKSLEKLLEDIASKIPPRVFRNAGKGVTIDFDNN